MNTVYIIYELIAPRLNNLNPQVKYYLRYRLLWCNQMVIPPNLHKWFPRPYLSQHMEIENPLELLLTTSYNGKTIPNTIIQNKSTQSPIINYIGMAKIDGTNITTCLSLKIIKK